MKLKSAKIIFTLALFTWVSLSVAQNALAATANITQIAFTNNPVTVAPGAISDRLTITTQNSAGTAETLSETSDLELSSSSLTGEFSSSNTSWSSDNILTMNNNSANRNFYYRDSTAGTHTITARLTTRISGLSWTTTQAITVGAGAPNNNATATSTTEGNGDENASTTQVSGGSSGGSAKKSSPSGALKVSAEIPRVASVQAPVNFLIISDKHSDNNGTRYYWSFGDGTVARGRVATHVYEFAGHYNVALTATRGDETVVLRAPIEIMEPQLRISATMPGPKGYIELENPSAKEINLEGWQISAAGESFGIPGPTYLGPKQKLKLPNKVSQLDPVPDQTVVLNFPSAELATTHTLPGPVLLAQAVSNLKITNLAPVTPVSRPVLAPVVSPSRIAPATTQAQLAAPAASGKTVILGEERPKQSWWQRVFSR